MMILGVTQPDYTALRSALQGRFGNAGWVRIEDILEFVRSDQTMFHDGHVKKPVLKPMEQEGRIEVNLDRKRRRSTYPPGCRIRFHQV